MFCNLFYLDLCTYIFTVIFNKVLNTKDILNQVYE